MSRIDLGDVPPAFGAAYTRYSFSSENDEALKVLQVRREELLKVTDGLLQDAKNRRSRLARDAGLVFDDIDAIRKAFPGDTFNMIPKVVTERRSSDSRPYDLIYEPDRDWRFYHCNSCNGWIPGQPRESRKVPSLEAMNLAELSYFCRICCSEIARCTCEAL